MEGLRRSCGMAQGARNFRASDGYLMSSRPVMPVPNQELTPDELRQEIEEWAFSQGYLPESTPAGKLADMPDEHWEFLEKHCVDWYETETHFFVHANAYPELPLDEQPPYMLYWEPFNDPAPHVSGKIMVCGHTPQKNGTPRNLGHALCLDTWAYGKGWLSCLDVTTGRLWQANQAGQERTAWLEDLCNRRMILTRR